MFNSAHYLLGCRFDNWLHLLFQNRFRLSVRYLPQALYITLAALVLLPFALLEKLIFAIPIRRSKVRQGPLFVLGHWRSGTTFLQNILSRDTQFGWADPVSVLSFNNCLLLRPLLTAVQRILLRDARPMDNLDYQVDLPIEENYAMGSISTMCIVHMLAFPRLAADYRRAAFIEEMPPARRRRWLRIYRHVLQKLTLVNQGKRLMLKTPDNTCRMAALHAEYPGSKFIYLYREPYAVIVSTIHMFNKMFNRMALQPAPPPELVEDTVIDIFRQMHAQYFRDLEQMPAGDVIEVRYEDLIHDPVAGLAEIYEQLGLPGFEAAKPRFEAYVSAQAGYQRNRFKPDQRLRAKVERELGFFYDRYHYPRQEVSA